MSLSTQIFQKLRLFYLVDIFGLSDIHVPGDCGFLHLDLSFLINIINIQFPLILTCPRDLFRYWIIHTDAVAIVFSRMKLPVTHCVLSRKLHGLIAFSEFCLDP